MRQIKVLSIVEATSVTGPARPILMHAVYVRGHETPSLSIRQSVLTTIRGSAGISAPSNVFTDAVHDAGLELDLCFERHPFDLQVFRQLRGIVQTRRPDIIETHSYKPHFLIWALRRWGGGALPHFGWVAYHHGYTTTSPRVLVYQQLDRLTLRHADRLVTFNSEFASTLERRGVEHARINILQNPVGGFHPPAQSDLAALRQTLGLTSGTLVVLSVGRLSREKAQGDLIQAFTAAAANRAPGATRLVIVGDGPERPALMRQAAATGAPISFVGHVDRVELYYAIADIFALPSHSEGSPMALLEAMAAGLPAAATSVGGVPEITENGASAILVKPRDVPALTRALESLLADANERERLGHAGHLLSKRFDIAAYAARLQSIYQDVLPAG